MKLTKYKELELSEMTDDQVLFFVRIHGKSGILNKYYPNELLQSFENIHEYRTISEYAIGDVHIDLNQVKLVDISHVQHQRFNQIFDLQDMILRCRALREISYAESRELIWKAAKFFDDYYRGNSKLKLIVSLIVDNYVMDVMARLAKHYNVEVMQVVGFFVPGYIRFTNRGHGIKVREVDNSEVESVLKRLETQSKSHMAISKTKAIKRVMADYVSYRYRYIFRYLWKYKVCGRLEYEYRFAPYFRGFHKLNKLLGLVFFDSLEKISSPSVFIPLHFHPEATIDYWSDIPDHADYLGSLLRVISFYRSKGVQVVIKEHPAYHLRRSISFYKQLKYFTNVVLIGAFCSSQEIANKTNFLCVHTGSAGLEGIMTDKPVYKITENYYSFGLLPDYKMLGEDYPKLGRDTKIIVLKSILETTLSINNK